jgi:FkbM family methyltransferase
MKTIVYYSQNREDLILSAFFPDIKKGFYVDVGAYDPKVDSVTKLFYDQGWKGINIEPQASRHKLFEASRKRDTNLAVGVSSESGTLALREYENGGLSTFSEEIKRGYIELASEGAEKFQEYSVDVRPLRDIFGMQQVGEIHFMKIDVEGLEYEVLEGNDWSRYRPQVICIEANHIVRDWRGILSDAGYGKVFFDGLNEYYLSAGATNRWDLFKKTYPERLVTTHFIPHNLDETIRELEKKLAHYDRHTKAQDHLIAVTEKELLELRRAQSSLRYLVGQIKKELRLRMRIRK